MKKLSSNAVPGRTVASITMMGRAKSMWPRLVLALALSAGAFGCTPATPEDSGTGGARSSGTGGGSPGPVGSGGVGVSASGGAANAAGGTVGSGGAAAGNQGGSVGTGGIVGGGTSGTGGAAGGSGALATGCNWVHDTANDTWKMNPPTAEKVVLFDGTSLSQWHMLNMPTQPAQWRLIPSAMVMEVVPASIPTNIQSNMRFDDVCVHVEYLTPVWTSADAPDLQSHGNSGVYLKSAYEMQILDTHDSPPINDGCGAVYKVAAPLVVACNQYLVWNTYEIEFKSSVWNNSTPRAKTSDAVFVQVTLNGKLVQRNVALNPAGGFTQAGIPDVAGPQPIALQDHRQNVQFRNIWVTIPRY